MRRPEATKDRSLEAYHFSPGWLPNLAPEAVDIASAFFGRRLPAPVVLDGTLPGTRAAAADHGLPLLVPLEELETTPPRRRAGSHAALVVQVQAAQALAGPLRALRSLAALRPAALLMQLDLSADARLPELLERVAAFCREAGLPVLVEEIGFGLGPAAVQALVQAGCAGAILTGVDRSRGWRSPRADFRPSPFAETLRRTRQALPGALLLAANGACGGADIAKELALGADLVLLPGAVTSEQVEQEIGVLRRTMCHAGTGSLAELRSGTVLKTAQEGSLRTHLEHLTLATAGGCEFIDLTAEVEAVVARARVDQGLVHVFAHHTTAAIRVNENEPLLQGDIRRFLDRLAPPGGYEHDDMSRRTGVPPDEPVNGHSHCRQLLLGGSETLPVLDGVVCLGRWQRIFLIELDGSRQRRVTVQVIGVGAG